MLRTLERFHLISTFKLQTIIGVISNVAMEVRSNLILSPNMTHHALGMGTTDESL